MSRASVVTLAALLLGFTACEDDPVPPAPPVPVTLATVERFTPP